MPSYGLQLAADLSNDLRKAFQAVTDIRDAAEAILNQDNGFPEINSLNQTHGEAMLYSLDLMILDIMI